MITVSPTNNEELRVVVGEVIIEDFASGEKINYGNKHNITFTKQYCTYYEPDGAIMYHDLKNKTLTINTNIDGWPCEAVVHNQQISIFEFL